ncbi:lysoplasmalogenase family protein [Gudongella sp. DL1XJH-153]|uniref:lysoplasmalogenase family protein n=1 Tax=Gudongella sp. DL1XJH-153 TaxID=3409804 RepID=UPI003BB69B1B
MNNFGRNLPVVFTVFTAVLITMEALGIDGDVISYSRYAVMLILCISVYVGRGSSLEQRRLFWAFPFMVVGDFFLVYSYTLDGFPQIMRYFGFIPFSIAYIIITRVYLEGFKWNINSILVAIIYGLSILGLGSKIYPLINGIEIVLGTIVALTVTIMAWAGASALWNGVYNRRVAAMMAISGMLMVVCDYGVALDLFYPEFYQIREELVLNLVWLTYIPGWVILALVVVDRDIKGRVYG